MQLNVTHTPEIESVHKSSTASPTPHTETLLPMQSLHNCATLTLLYLLYMSPPACWSVLPLDKTLHARTTVHILGDVAAALAQCLTGTDSTVLC